MAGRQESRDAGPPGGSNHRGDSNGKAVTEKRGEIYTYEAPCPVYAMNWSVRSFPPSRLFFVAKRSWCTPPMARADAPNFPRSQVREDMKFRLAVGSFVEDVENVIEIIRCECLGA